MIFALAEDSMKLTLAQVRARFSPWSLPTTRSSSKSDLLPTRTIGTYKEEEEKEEEEVVEEVEKEEKEEEEVEEEEEEEEEEEGRKKWIKV